jgi:hypothetical protein
MLKELPDVFEEAFKDRKFLDDLLADSEKALAGKSWELSDENRQKLNSILNKDQMADPRTILEAFNTTYAKGRPWDPPPWNPAEPIDNEQMK